MGSYFFNFTLGWATIIAWAIIISNTLKGCAIIRAGLLFKHGLLIPDLR